MTGGPVPGCVFCDPAAQPEPLFVLEGVRAVPDKYPLFPGHTLIISNQHLDCYGAASSDVLAQLDGAAARVRDFIRAVYQREPLCWENGVSGQSVFHAHLHLIPSPLTEFPAYPEHANDWLPIDGWDDVVEHYRRHENYHYAQLGDRRVVLYGDGPAAWEMRRILGRAAGVKLVDGRFVRATTPDDVSEAARRWAEWEGSAG